MRRALATAIAVVAGAAVVNGCGTGSTAEPAAEAGDTRTIAVSYSVLGSLVAELVGGEAGVEVLMPGGVDPHEWEPSARDVEALESADLVVVNGLGFEEGLDPVLDETDVPVFTATDHVALRTDGGAGDPHIWTDPLAMTAVVAALAEDLDRELGLDVAARASRLEQRLDALDAELRRTLAAVPATERKLVTGHESLGYFADRYGFELVGAVVPSSSSQAEASAGELAALKEVVEREGVGTVFTETGAPSRAAEAVAAEAGAKVVELPSHTLPADGSYFTFMLDLAARIADAARS
jgi:zinc/manganese transport system substrate-binding protein